MRARRHRPSDADAIELLKMLVAAQRDGEAAVQEVVVARLLALEGDVSRQTYRPKSVELREEFADEAEDVSDHERTNVIARFRGDRGLRSIMLYAHPDSEPPTSTAGWSFDPFVLHEVDGRLYGWGIADDLAGIAASVIAIERALADSRPLGDVVMVSGPSKRHARGIVAALCDDVVADAALYMHPAESGVGIREIKSATNGYIEFVIEIVGRPPNTAEPIHVAMAHRAVNPVDKAFSIASALRDLDEERASRLRHGSAYERVGRSTNILISSLLSGPNGKRGRVPEFCEIHAAASIPPGEPLASIRHDITRAIDVVCSNDPWLAANRPVVRWVSGTPGAECAPHEPFFQAVAHAVSQTTGAQPGTNPLHSASDIRNPIVQKNIPSVGIGCICGNLTQNMLVDEWVEKEEYLTMIHIAESVIRSWAGRPA